MAAEPLDFFSRGHSWEERLEYVVDTMRELSSYTEPHSMVAAFSARMRTLRLGRVLSLSRRGVEPPKFVLARDSRWERQPSPWRERNVLPVMEGGLLGELAYGNEVRVVPDFEPPADDPAADILRGYRSLLAIPVFDGGEARNVVVFLREEPAAFDPEDLPHLVWITNLMGRLTHSLVLAEELKRAYSLLDRELRIIAEIQRGLLPPELPHIPSLDLAVYYRPAARAGGDYYDFFPLPDGRWGMLIADVSGHGSPAAVEMAITRTLAHVRTREPASPSELLSFVNEHLAARPALPRGAFVTAFCGAYDPGTYSLRYASAGHHVPRVKRCMDGSLFPLEVVGAPPLGVVKGQGFEETEVNLIPGDQVILYTDGITEAFNAERQMFGVERLDRSLTECREEAQKLVDAVLDDLEAFTRGREPDDDITLLCALVTAE